MSYVSLNFLSDSILLDRAAQENLFSDLTDKELAKELSNYREHVLARLEELKKEVLADGEPIGCLLRHLPERRATDPSIDASRSLFRSTRNR